MVNTFRQEMGASRCGNGELAGGDILNIVIYAASMALEREGSGCRIKLDDFLAAIEASKRAKEEVGSINFRLWIFV